MSQVTKTSSVMPRKQDPSKPARSGDGKYIAGQYFNCLIPAELQESIAKDLNFTDIKNMSQNGAEYFEIILHERIINFINNSLKIQIKIQNDSKTPLSFEEKVHLLKDPNNHTLFDKFKFYGNFSQNFEQSNFIECDYELQALEIISEKFDIKNVLGRYICEVLIQTIKLNKDELFHFYLKKYKQAYLDSGEENKNDLFRYSVCFLKNDLMEELINLGGIHPENWKNPDEGHGFAINPFCSALIHFQNNYMGTKDINERKLLQILERILELNPKVITYRSRGRYPIEIAKGCKLELVEEFIEDKLKNSPELYIQTLFNAETTAL